MLLLWVYPTIKPLPPHNRLRTAYDEKMVTSFTGWISGLYFPNSAACNSNSAACKVAAKSRNLLERRLYIKGNITGQGLAQYKVRVGPITPDFE